MRASRECSVPRGTAVVVSSWLEGLCSDCMMGKLRLFVASLYTHVIARQVHSLL